MSAQGVKPQLEDAEAPIGEGQGPPPGSAPAQLSLLAPPAAKVRASVVRLPGHWFIVATAQELRRTPLSRTLLGVPLVLFRDDNGRPGALLDRCPHRNVPLSLGQVVGGQLQCSYHGWRFDTGGACRLIPSLIGEVDGKARRALSYPAVEQDGFIWVYSTAGEMPDSLPYRFPKLGTPGYTSVSQVVYSESTMHAALENALDVPHTQFLHSGLFRSKSRGIEITANVRRTADRVVAEYVGEPRPTGLVARLLSPSGGMVTHFDRFILPSIAEVEYSLGSENHFLVSAAMTPISDFQTQINSVVSFKLRLLPAFLVKFLLKPLALRIFRQDAAILKLQTENIRRFGGEQFASTDIDVLGRHIWRLLRAAERGERAPSSGPDEEVREEQVRLIL
jgi:phenylpropionate dioxygenase-like ring-hydroxylating dioxygenase large terminal subunit